MAEDHGHVITCLLIRMKIKKKSPTNNGKNIERRYNNEWGKHLHVNFCKYVENRKL